MFFFIIIKDNWKIFEYFIIGHIFEDDLVMGIGLFFITCIYDLKSLLVFKENEI